MTREDYKIYKILIKLIEKLNSGKYVVRCKYERQLLDEDYEYMLNVKDKSIDIYYYYYYINTLIYDEYNITWWLVKK